MLSALKHEWGILALFVVVDRSQPNHTRLAVKIRNEYRAVVTDDRARHQNLSLVLPLAALRNTNGKRKSTSVSLYSIQMKWVFTVWSLGVPMKIAGNTGALQGFGQYCLNVIVAYN